MVKIIFWVVIQSWLLICGLHSFWIISPFFGRFLFEFVICQWCSFGGSLRTRDRWCRVRRALNRGRGTLSTFSFEIEMGEYCTGSFPRLGNLSNLGYCVGVDIDDKNTLADRGADDLYNPWKGSWAVHRSRRIWDGSWAYRGGSCPWLHSWTLCHCGHGQRD